MLIYCPDIAFILSVLQKETSTEKAIGMKEERRKRAMLTQINGTDVDNGADPTDRRTATTAPQIVAKRSVRQSHVAQIS